MPGADFLLEPLIEGQNWIVQLITGVSEHYMGERKSPSSLVQAPAATQITFITLGYAGTTHGGETPDIMLYIAAKFCNNLLNICCHL